MARVQEQNRFSVRRIGISLSEGIVLTAWADRTFDTCPPKQSQHLIRVISCAAISILWRDLRLRSSTEPMRVPERTDLLPVSGT